MHPSGDLVRLHIREKGLQMVLDVHQQHHAHQSSAAHLEETSRDSHTRLPSAQTLVPSATHHRHDSLTNYI